jgi:cytoskeletal protein RodZ
MESIGEILRETRHAKKKSLEDISRATKIKMDILEKLEADDYTSMPGPMYTKGFLKIYADHLGLDSDSIVATYLKSQGGLRRQGLHMETEVQIQARRQRELQLPLGSVIRVVAALTVVVLIVMGGHHLWMHHQSTPAVPALTVPAKSGSLPTAEFDAYYQPKQKPSAEVLEPPKP